MKKKKKDDKVVAARKAKRPNKFHGVSVEQGVDDLPKCHEDIDKVEDMCLKLSFFEKDIIRLDNPTWKKLSKARSKLIKGMMAKPDETHLVIVAAAGHGI